MAKESKSFRVEIIERTVSGPIVVGLERVHGAAGKQRPDGFAVHRSRMEVTRM